jgi:hypothetical protein
MICTQMKQRTSLAMFMALALMASAQNASASSQEPEHEVVDARLEGYGRNVTLNGGTALTWVLMVFLGGVCLIGMFKDAKRSHLD